MRISGDLAPDGARTVLRLLGKNGSSGVLRLRSSIGGARIHIRDGLVLAATLESQPRLGEALVADGVLSADQIETALSTQRRSRGGRPLGQVLVELGLIERGALGLALERQIRRVVFGLLSWTEGSYAFEPGAESDPDASFVGIELTALLAELANAQGAR